VTDEWKTKTLKGVPPVDDLPPPAPSQGKLDTEPVPKCTYWVTRNTVEGVIANTVEIWIARPERMLFEDGDVMWMGSLSKIDEESAWYDEWTIANCLKQCRVIPDTDREVIVVGVAPLPERKHGQR
jgi:hypothetical protein